LQRDRQPVEARHPHPAGHVGLFDPSSGRQRPAAVEDPAGFDSEKAALKNVLSPGILAIDLPSEIQEQLVEHAFQELPIVEVLPFLLDFVQPPSRPSLARWVHVAQGPFVGGNLSLRMHIPLAQHEDD